MRSITACRGWAWVAITAVTVLSLGLRARVPLNPKAWAAAPHDDGMFERAAMALANHDWLGSFDRLTLIKGPGYPLFIHASGWLGLPLGVATQLTYLGGAAALAVALHLTFRRLWAAGAVYAILALDPMNFSAGAAAVLRDNWYAGLSLLAFSLVFITTFLAVVDDRLWWALPLSVLTGLVLAGFWLTREDGIWLVPALAVGVVGLAWTRIRRAPVSEPMPNPAPTTRPIGRWSGLVLVAVVAGASFLLPIKVVTWRNHAVYQVAITSDMASGAFPEAYSTWARVRGVPLREYVPIDQAQRAAAYAVSPAAAELRTVLEDPANAWKGFGCASVGVCDDYAGGWMSWAIRDAAAATGHFGSESDAQTYFRRLRDEIAAACDDGGLACAPALPDSMALLLRASVPDVVRSFARQLSELPFADVFYDAPDPAAVNPIDPVERAALGRVIVGVAANDAEASEATGDYRSSAWGQPVLGLLYRILFVLLALLTVAAVVLAIRRRRERVVGGSLVVLVMALATGVLIRLLLFAVADTTQFAIEARYHWATRTFLLALLAVGGVVGLTLIRARLTSRPSLRGRHQAP